MANSQLAAGTALPPAPRYCGFIHGPCTCEPTTCTGLIRQFIDGELELTACLCTACAEQEPTP